MLVRIVQPAFSIAVGIAAGVSRRKMKFLRSMKVKLNIES
ncbi:hypothetical protein X772_25780 [Mesorhizobium sp. LSJC280B00]|nr:hypothetical protein X772_25780 [Mesorhizobium sp. LSJC280B00]